MNFDILCESCGASLDYSISRTLAICIVPCKCIIAELEAATDQISELDANLEQALDQLADCRKHAPELFL